MPSPLAHLAAGALLARYAVHGSPPRESSSRRWRVFAVAALISLAPDLDTIPGLFAGSIRSFHNQATHSLVFGLGVCLGTACALRGGFPAWRFRRVLGFLCAGYGLHLLMDWLTSGRGIKLLWPFSQARFSAPLPLFYGLRYSEGWLSHHHLITLANEVSLVAAVVLVIYGLSGRRGSTSISGISSR